MSEDCLTCFVCVCVGKTSWALIVTAARSAQLEERQSADQPKSLKNW